MRKVVAAVTLGAFMMVGLSGCDLWWSETVSHGGGTNYARSACEVDMYNPSTSGYVKERADSLQVADGFGNWINTGFINGDVGWVANTQPNHYWSTDTLLWSATTHASTGEKYITGIYQGEAFHMGFISQGQNPTNVLLRARVVDGAGNVINTTSNCAQVSA